MTTSASNIVPFHRRISPGKAFQMIGSDIVLKLRCSKAQHLFIRGSAKSAPICRPPVHLVLPDIGEIGSGGGVIALHPRLLLHLHR